MAFDKIKKLLANLVSQKPQAYKNNFYSFGPGIVTRRFVGNGVSFINVGTVTCTINDIFPLVAGASISISGDKNEIDLTVYKLNVPAAGLLSVVIKEDLGIEEQIIEQEEPIGIIPDRRKKNEGDK